MSTLICISTYLKNSALKDLLDSLIKFGYHEQAKIAICDDSNDFHAKPIYEEYRKKCKLIYLSGGINSGIAINKNRGLKYFLSKPHFEDILMLDDDLIFYAPNFLEHCRKVCGEIKLPLISGLWTDFRGEQEEEVKGASGNGWYSDFPVVAETEHTTWHFQGCHGCCLYMKREVVEKVGYMNNFTYHYGYEHSAYFSRALYASGSAPELFPVLKHSDLWYRGNCIPNNYEIDRDQVFNVNGVEHAELIRQVYMGYGIYNKEHGLKKKKEIVLE